MTKQLSREILQKIRKLAQLPEEARQCHFAVSITRLTILKSLCQEPEMANRFVTYLAQRTRQKVQETTKRPRHPSMPEWARHRELIDRAVEALEEYLEHPAEERRSGLWTLFHELAAEQNEYRRIYGGPVRMIKNNDLLLVEYALRTVLADETSAPVWAYQTARDYAERYDGKHGTGLIPESAPLLQDIVAFWMQEFALTPESVSAPTRTRPPKEKTPPARPGKQKIRFTHRQGQFLAYIHLYRKLHHEGPAEQDMVQFFGVAPPSVHSMVVRLEESGLVTREPGVPRSIRVAIPEDQIPELKEGKKPRS